MNKIMSVIKGSLIGAANIIPGISGGTLMVIFNVYERLLNAVNLFLKHPIKALASIWDLLLGLLLGLVGSFLILSYTYQTFPLALTLLFIGLIVGGIKPLYEKIKGKISVSNSIILVVSFVVIFIMPLIKPFYAIYDGFIYYIILFILGLIVAFSAIAPGVSGSLMLIILGYYSHLLLIGKEAFEHLIRFEFKAFLPYLLPFGILIISFLIGAVFSLKIIKNIIDKHETKFYFSVMGMILASPFAIMLMLNKTNSINSFHYLEWIIGILLLSIGFLVVTVVVYFENKKRQTSGN